MAALRHLPLELVERLIEGHAHSGAGGLLGPDSVNVLALNMAVDASGAR